MRVIEDVRPNFPGTRPKSRPMQVHRLRREEHAQEDQAPTSSEEHMTTVLARRQAGLGPDLLVSSR